MDAFTKHQSTDKKSEYIPPANFTVLENFLDTASKKHTEEFGKFYLDDPTTIGFSLMFYWSSPLFNMDIGLGESAYHYLLYSGETVRAEKLKRFISQLFSLSQNHPHFFLTLSGLGNIYEFLPGESVHEKELTIETNESMDLRIASIVENYVHATYDARYRRRTVPINLTEFKMKIVLSEIRSFRSFVGNLVNGTYVDGNFKELNRDLGIYDIDFERCTFDFSESNPFLDTINNSQPEIAENSFKIITGNTHFDHNKIDVFDVLYKDNTIQRPKNPDVTQPFNKKQSRLNKLGNDLKGQVRSTVTDGIDIVKDEFDRKKEQILTDYNPINVAGQMINRYFTDVIDSKFKQAVLGNVYFTEQIPSGAGLADDIINGRSPNIAGIAEGRLGDPKGLMREAILGYDSLNPRSEQDDVTDNNLREEALNSDDISKRSQISKKDALFRTLTEVFDNADKLTTQEIETILEYFAKSNLGNVFTNGNNID